MLAESLTEHILATTSDEPEDDCAVTNNTIYEGDLIALVENPSKYPNLKISRPGCHELAEILEELVDSEGSTINRFGVTITHCESDIQPCDCCGEMLTDGDTAAVYTILDTSRSLWLHYPGCAQETANTLPEIDEYIPHLTLDKL